MTTRCFAVNGGGSIGKEGRTYNPPDKPRGYNPPFVEAGQNPLGYNPLGQPPSLNTRYDVTRVNNMS